MRQLQPCSFRASALATSMVLIVASLASAQRYDPYNPTSSGGSYIPGTRYVFPVQPRGPLSVIVPLGANTYAQWPFYPGTSPIMMASPVGTGNNATALYPGAWPRGVPYPTALTYSGSISSSNTTGSGYRTGGAYASPTQSRSQMSNSSGNQSAPIEVVLPDRAAPAVQQPRNAFNKWKDQRQQQGQPARIARNEDDLARNLTQPELKDVISGEALNVVMESLNATPDKLKKTAPIAIEEGTLKQLNFTRGTGSIGLLRDEGRIAWPEPLLALASIAPARQAIETRFSESYVKAAEGGQADLAVLDDMLKRVDQLSEQIAASEKPLTFAENVQAKRFLASLEDSVRFLKQSDAADWLPGKCKLKPATVQELLQIMNEKRIRFAPALIGNDNVYISTHLMLVRVHKQATLSR